jgi:hypothetical protein
MSMKLLTETAFAAVVLVRSAGFSFAPAELFRALLTPAALAE